MPKVSEKPWSDYSASDYSPEQWHTACLIHQHEGAPTSKNQCKLPVKTPDGTLSRAGVHAAAAAYAGARGGVGASSSEMAAACKALVRYYQQLGEEPPESLKHAMIEDYLAHFGVKGMRWGQRKSDITSGQSSVKHSALESKGKSFIRRAMGDKTYWTRAAVITGVAGAGLALAATAPAVLPASILIAAGGAAHFSTVMTATSLTGLRVGNLINYINYRKRLKESDRTAFQKAIPLGSIGHSDGQLAHAEPTVQDVYNDMSKEQKSTAAILVAAAVENVDVSGDITLTTTWASMTDTQRAVTYFLADVSKTAQTESEMEKEVTHMDDVDEFLSHLGVTTLTHLAADGAGDAGGGGKKGGKFDESKVKRDGGGKFSRKEMRGNIKDKLDLGWLKRVENMGHELIANHRKELEELRAKIAKKNGVNAEEIGSHPKAEKELKTAFLSKVNEIASNEGVNPSGTKRIQYAYNDDGSIRTQVVPHTGPNPNRGAVRDFVTERVSERTGETKEKDKDAHPWWRFANFGHGDVDLVNEFLSHYGIKHADPAKKSTMAAIVALPRVMDPVRLIGDEEKHATLLFFGETSSLPSDARSNLISVLTKASRMYSPFGESVMGVSRLGSDTPPALVAMLSNRCLGQIRGILQMDSNVGDYQKNVVQHPQFMPHVTLGYPDYQNEQKVRELIKQVYRVKFDRLALWWNDERIEFDLNQNSVEEDSEMATHSDVVDEFLSHYGIRGMRWGIRRPDGPSGNVGSKGGRHDNADTDGDGKNDTRLSADAERVMGTLSKESHEMSTREMKEALERAKQVKQYKDTFGNSEMDRQLTQMRKLKEYKDLKAELTPEKVSKVQKFAKGAGTAFAAYQQIDGVLGGQLSAGLSKKVGAGLGLKQPGPSQLDLLKTKKDTLSLTRDNMKIEADIKAMSPKPLFSSSVKPSFSSSFGTKAISDARASVQDAKDLNGILNTYLSNQKPSSGYKSPIGPTQPKPGTVEYGLSLIGKKP